MKDVEWGSRKTITEFIERAVQILREQEMGQETQND